MSSLPTAISSTPPDALASELLTKYDVLNEACLVAWRFWVDTHKMGATPLSAELLTKYHTACSLRAAAEQALLRHGAVHATPARGAAPRRDAPSLASGGRSGWAAPSTLRPSQTGSRAHP